MLKNIMLRAFYNNRILGPSRRRPRCNINVTSFGLANESAISYFFTVEKHNQLSTTNINLEIKYSNSTCTPNFIEVGPNPALKLVEDLYSEWLLLFQQNNVTDPELSIQYIIEHVINAHQDLGFKSLMKKEVTKEQVERIRTLCECRLARMPVQYLIKEWDFRELRLAMVPPVFIPRPETEQLVDLVLKHVSPQSRFLEVGCGSGAICLSLLHALPQAQVTAIDQSKLACLLTKKNAELNELTNNLTVLVSKLEEDGSLREPLPVTSVDVIVSNPPYVPSMLLPTLQPEITLYEDLRALDGGRDGLKLVKALFILSQRLLASGGDLFLEVDSSHPPAIAKWLDQHPELNLRLAHTHRDYCDKDRFVHIKKL